MKIQSNNQLVGVNDQEIKHLFDNIFGWAGFSIAQMKNKIKSFLKKEQLTLNQVREEIN